MLKDILTKNHNVLSSHEKATKILYISDAFEKDELFNKDVMKLYKKYLKQCSSIPKKVTLSDFTQEELLDITNPIQ